VSASQKVDSSDFLAALGGFITLNVRQEIMTEKYGGWKGYTSRVTNVLSRLAPCLLLYSAGSSMIGTNLESYPS
jgi:hypothetical protein